MKNLKFKLLTQFFICFSIFSTLSAKNNEGLVTEVKIYDNDSTYKLKYFYDNKLKVLETKLYLKNDIWVNLDPNINRCYWEYISSLYLSGDKYIEYYPIDRLLKYMADLTKEILKKKACCNLHS